MCCAPWQLRGWHGLLGGKALLCGVNQEGLSIPINTGMGPSQWVGPFLSDVCREASHLQAVPVHLPSPGSRSLISPGAETV